MEKHEPPPIARIAVAACSTAVAVRLTATTAAPSRADAEAWVAPSPPPDPVTMATFPEKRILFRHHEQVTRNVSQ